LLKVSFCTKNSKIDEAIVTTSKTALNHRNLCEKIPKVANEKAKFTKE
jgi:hypothetical protein